MNQGSDLIEVQASSARLFEVLKIMRDENILTDFTIIIGDIQIKVHKVILYSSSDYFKGLLRSDTKEARQNEVKLDSSQVSLSAMTSILDFMYSGKLGITCENVQEIFIASSFLQIAEITNNCVEFIRRNIDIGNCLDVLTIADRYKIKELEDRALGFCAIHFNTILEHEDVSSIEESILVKLISLDSLNVPSEIVVFQAIELWISSQDSSDKLDIFERLLSHVRFAYMDPHDLVSLQQSDSFKNSARCRELISEATSHLLLRNCPEHTYPTYPSSIGYGSRDPTKSIYAIGGWDRNRPLASVERYDVKSDEWTEIKPMSSPRFGMGVAIHENSIYVIGGHDGENYLKTIERYDLIKNKWISDVADMQHARASLCVIIFGGYIYAIGGQQRHDALDIVERYDPRENKWFLCNPMNKKRLGASVACNQNHIILFGGSDGPGNNSKIVDSVEYYDIESDKWSTLFKDSVEAKHQGCVTYGQDIYLAGGIRSGEEMTSFRKISLNKSRFGLDQANTFTQLPNLSKQRSGVSLVELAGFIYAVGGDYRGEKLDLVEAFDTKSERWALRKSMLQKRVGCGVVAYDKDLPNSIDELIGLVESVVVK